MQINDITTLRLPLWEDLPDFGIYKDQLVSLIKDILNPLFITENSFITPSMINNYVKLRLMPQPIKKKYYRKHIASILVLTTLKQVLNLDDITKGIRIYVKRYGYEDAYNVFCECLLKNIEDVFVHEKVEYSTEESLKKRRPLEIISLALCMKLYTQIILNDRQDQGELNGKDSDIN